MLTDGLLILLDRYSSTFYKDGNASSILLVVQGKPSHCILFDQLYTGDSPKILNALGLTTPQFDLSLEVGPA